MSLLDLLLGLIVGTSIVAGFVAGFARVGIGFCAAVAGVVCGFWFYSTPAGWFHRYIHSEALSNVLGFLVVFWAILVVGAIIAKIVATFFRWTGLSWIDRFLGGVFGFVRGAVIGVGFVAVLMAFAPKPLPNWMVNSKLLPYAVDGSNLFASMAPSDLKNAIRDALEELRKDWEAEVKKSQRRKNQDQPGEPKRLGNKELI